MARRRREVDVVTVGGSKTCKKPYSLHARTKVLRVEPPDQARDCSDGSPGQLDSVEIRRLSNPSMNFWPCWFVSCSIVD